MAMVNSDKGITNLHVPSDIIIDASIPPLIRDSGKMWGPDGKLHDTKVVIPDASYARSITRSSNSVKRTALSIRKPWAACPTSVSWRKRPRNTVHTTRPSRRLAWHDPCGGCLGKSLLEHQVEEGDIWRMCQVKDAPIRDWVKLAVNRAKATGAPAIFWLDKTRAHDAQLITKVERYLKDHDTKGLDIRIMTPADAMRLSLERIKEGRTRSL